MGPFNIIYRKLGPIAESAEFKALRKSIYSLSGIRCGVEMEFCYYIEIIKEPCTSTAGEWEEPTDVENFRRKVAWLVAETFEPDFVRISGSFFTEQNR